MVLEGIEDASPHSTFAMNTILFRWKIDDPDEVSAHARLSAIVEQLSQNGVRAVMAADRDNTGQTTALGLATYGPDRLIIVIQPDRHGRWRGEGASELPAALAGAVKRAWLACE